MKLIILFLLLSFTPTKTNAIPKEKTIQKTNYRNSVENNKLINFLNSYLESEIINLDNVKNTITKNKHLINLRVNKNNPLEVVLDREDCKTNAIHTEDEIFKIIELLLENGAEINFTYESPDGELPIIFDFLYLITNSRFYNYMKLFIKHGLTVNTKLIERVKYHSQFAKKTELESFKKTLNLLYKEINIKKLLIKYFCISRSCSFKPILITDIYNIGTFYSTVFFCIYY